MEPAFERMRVLDLLLNRENPRHEPKLHQAEIIEHLLKDEKVYNLARHIGANGVNPLELVAVFHDNGSVIVAEGNRRVCALQLLNDPMKAPTAYRKRFEGLSKAGSPEEILVARFESYDEARPWLQILHDGEQDGVGRKTWRAEQKARATLRQSTDNLAVSLLDFAERTGILAPGDRHKINLSTMTRYLANPQVRSAMGIATTTTSAVTRVTIPPTLFKEVVTRFISDTREGSLSSRSVSLDWHDYAKAISRDLDTASQVGSEYALSGILTLPITPSKLPTKQKLRLATGSPDFIGRAPAVVDQLNLLASAKLTGLYQSLTSLKLSEHPALLTAGAWVFFESLTALHGRASGIEFDGYLQGRHSSWGTDKRDKKEIGLSTKYISDHGNAEKHSSKFTSADAKNLKTHFDILNPTITRLLAECPR